MAFALEVHELTRNFGGLRALDACSIAVTEGTITGLVGPNGSGKSTLLDCVTGTLRPDGGKVSVFGEDITRVPAAKRVRRGLARTFQNTRVFNKLTARENIQASLLLSRCEESAGGLDGVLERVGLGAHADSPAGSLSYGQKKLLELALVLATDPRVVLLDEPAAGVNPVVLDGMAERLRALRDEGRTVLIVEHNFPFLHGLCDHVIVLVGGRWFAEGDPPAIQADERVLEAYLGAP